MGLQGAVGILLEASNAPQQTSKPLITCLNESTGMPLETAERHMLILARPWT